MMSADSMPPVYFAVRFRIDGQTPTWPEHFAIVTAYATTGEQWTPEHNRAADVLLAARLVQDALWHCRITGYAPDTGHAEPGYAVALGVDEACALGVEFLQDAIYVVQGDALFVTYCDERRGLVPVGTFRERIDRTDD